MISVKDIHLYSDTVGKIDKIRLLNWICTYRILVKQVLGTI